MSRPTPILKGKDAKNFRKNTGLGTKEKQEDWAGYMDAPAETKQEELITEKDLIRAKILQEGYDAGFKYGVMSERSRHEKELEEIKERFCVYNCDTFCKIIPTCDKFNYVFGIRKKEVRCLRAENEIYEPRIKISEV
jgi:hypothetical protein